MLHSLISRRKPSIQVVPKYWGVDGFHRELYIRNITEKNIGMESGSFLQLKDLSKHWVEGLTDGV